MVLHGGAGAGHGPLHRARTPLALATPLALLDVAAQFRWAALSEFMSTRSTFVWGGAMLLRKHDLDANTYGLLDWWLNGGYSDDMQVRGCTRTAGQTAARTTGGEEVVRRRRGAWRCAEDRCRAPPQVQACAQDHRRAIATPLAAIFPNSLKRAVSAAYCWDFLLRQNFVLCTPLPRSQPRTRLSAETT